MGKAQKCSSRPANRLWERKEFLAPLLDAYDIGEALGLSQKTVDTIHNYLLPELMDPSNRFSAFTYVALHLGEAGFIVNFVSSPGLGGIPG
jgi:hypothetical protein